jgi:hypothetical protein
MTSDPVPAHVEAFRSAIEVDDYARAEAAIQEHAVWLQAGPRTLEEIEQARNLFQWGIQVARARKAHVAEELDELVRLKKVIDGYAPRTAAHVWHIDG